MKEVYEVLRQKEFELSKLKEEVEALRIAAPLLSDDEVGDDNKPTSARSMATLQPIRVPQAVNDSPQPTDAPEWKDRARGWP
jgi:hypothetical protein